MLRKIQNLFCVSNRPILICGCGHSGTSLLLKMLGRHSNLHSIPYESNIGSSKQLRAMAREFNEMTKAESKSRWIEKTPRNVYHIQRIRRKLPSCQIVFIRRNGFAVVNSLLKRYGDLEQAIQRWECDNREVDRWLDKSWTHLVRYESLVRETPRAVSGVLDFLGEPFEDNCLCPIGATGNQKEKENHPDRVYKPEEHIQFRDWQINQPIFDNIDRWRTELKDVQIKKIKERLAPMLEQYGY